MDVGVDTQRLIPLAGSYNLRDIGGYKTRDGHLIRSRIIFRSGNLDHLPLASQHVLIMVPHDVKSKTCEFLREFSFLEIFVTWTNLS